MSSYHEFGDVLGNINLTAGNVVVEEGCKASAVVIDMTAQQLATVTTLSADNSKAPEVPIILNTSETLWGANPHNDLIDPEKNNIIYANFGGGTLPENFDTLSKEDKEAAIATASASVQEYAVLVNEKGYNTFAEAWSKISNNCVVKLLKDCTETNSKGYFLINGKTVTLDLNGHVLDLNGTTFGLYVYKSNNTKLIIKDSANNNGKVTNSSGYTIALAKDLIIENGIIENTKNDGYTVYGFSDATASIVMNGGEVVSKNGWAMCFCSSGTIDIYNGVVDGKNNAIAINGEMSDNTRTINIYGGTFNGGIYKPDGGNLVISGGTFNGGIYVKGGTLKITDGSFKGFDVEESKWKHLGSGCVFTSAAIIVEGCNYPAGDPFMIVTGGNFASGSVGDNGGTYGILVIDYDGNTVLTTGTTVSYRHATVAKDAEIVFTDSNTDLVRP